MNTLTKEALEAVMPKATLTAQWTEALNDAMEAFGIDTPERQAMFIAQVAHESDELRSMEENLNYSAKALQATWPSRFPSKALAEKYARKPKLIANKVYANRLGNGDTESGDGWRYRGRGPIQITGKDNYVALQKATGVDVVYNPDIVNGNCTVAALSAAWFFAVRGNCLPLADNKDVENCTKRINGGLNGLQNRKMYYDRACEALNVK